ncbi:uncharacterized protein I206_103472 [Kwoniella pini CBS 10737]|uniref:Uncharacterized protein n=1 Tax=Kwoniella pini CBS 10737 TaxID=1296096 RepID=A0A1B9I9K8_9TREE|nr:uncharacterized protein I206_01525 [Kwoniella pini CBS 10737]OCF52239.1 hypothetical protein I206_01525 [Kwoniella pini CBS 10737]
MLGFYIIPFISGFLLTIIFQNTCPNGLIKCYESYKPSLKEISNQLFQIHLPNYSIPLISSTIEYQLNPDYTKSTRIPIPSITSFQMEMKNSAYLLNPIISPTPYYNIQPITTSIPLTIPLITISSHRKLDQIYYDLKQEFEYIQQQPYAYLYKSFNYLSNLLKIEENLLSISKEISINPHSIFNVLLALVVYNLIWEHDVRSRVELKKAIKHSTQNDLNEDLLIGKDKSQISRDLKPEENIYLEFGTTNELPNELSMPNEQIKQDSRVSLRSEPPFEIYELDYPESSSGEINSNAKSDVDVVLSELHKHTMVLDYPILFEGNTVKTDFGIQDYKQSGNTSSSSSTSSPQNHLPDDLENPTPSDSNSTKSSSNASREINTMMEPMKSHSDIILPIDAYQNIEVEPLPSNSITSIYSSNVKSVDKANLLKTESESSKMTKFHEQSVPLFKSISNSSNSSNSLSANSTSSDPKFKSNITRHPFSKTGNKKKNKEKNEINIDSNISLTTLNGNSDDWVARIASLKNEAK